ncbi:MAG: hypothetical protein EBZ49_11330 [Proteobacteria bacterium]|nr:hypothetical protein [Pseudomonadota bacterium]
MKHFIQMGVGLSVATFLTGCDTRLAMPSGGAAISGSSNNATLSPVVPAASASHILSGKKAYDSEGSVIIGSMANLGVLDLSQTPASSGYYSSTSNAPTVSQICATETILGVTGNRICQNTSMVAQNSDQILSGNTFYDADGNKKSGTLTTSTPTQTSITGEADNNSFTQDTVTPAANGLFSSFTINLGVDFLKENICSGKTIFGRVGTAVCNALFGDAIYSMAPRSDLATPPTSSSNRQVAKMSEEVSSASQFTNNYDLVPKPEYVTDGRYGNGIAAEKKHYLETIVGRPNTVCGTSGTIEERVSDCDSKNGNKAFYSGKNYGQSGEGDWKLVTRTSGGYEVWRDERTKLIWSDTLSSGYNWCQAAGYSSNSDTTNMTGYNCQAGAEGSLQPATPISVCADASLLEELNGVSTYATPSSENEPKGNLSVSSVKWRLPTLEDWKLADVNGIRKVLPNMDAGFWSASSLSDSVSSAWFFSGGDGSVYFGDRHYGVSVRCVGR